MGSFGTPLNVIFAAHLVLVAESTAVSLPHITVVDGFRALGSVWMTKTRAEATQILSIIQ